MPLAIGLAGAVALGLVRSRDPRAMSVIIGRIRKFSADTVVLTDALQATRFRPAVPLTQGLRETVAADFQLDAR